MIRINLLPVRAAKKKESVRFQYTVAGLVTFLALAASLAVYFTARSEASVAAEQISNGQQELVQLKKKIGVLSKIKKQKKVVEAKLKIIKNLEAARTGPVILFRIIEKSRPSKVWLKSITDKGSVVSLAGYAENDEDMAEFMRRLAKFPQIKHVELDVARRAQEKETKTEVVSFVLKLIR
jgi:type IV pilus assembly protein PilN